MNAPSRTQPGWQRGFWSLIVVQCQGAFSDNALKNLVIFLILGMGLPEGTRNALVPVVGALFAVPFILFSMMGGWLADRLSKRTVTRGIKVFELGIMLFAAAGLGLRNLYMQLAAVFLMGVHSAMFGPSKYGLLPELLPLEKLSWGNGILELGTFVAIITGTMAGAFLSEHFAGMQYWSGLMLAALAIVGFFLSHGITPVSAAAPDKKFRPNFIAELWGQTKIMQKDKALWLANCGNTWFFFLAALLQMNLFIHARDALHLTETRSGLLQAMLAIGIGVGSAVAGFASRGRIEYGLIPLGTIGLAVSGAALAWPGLGPVACACWLVVLGFSGGFFIVPVSALLQHRPAPDNKGGILAASNLMSFIGIFLASGVDYVLASVLHLGPRAVFLFCAVITAITAGLIIGERPAALPGFVRRTFHFREGRSGAGTIRGGGEHPIVAREDATSF